MKRADRNKTTTDGMDEVSSVGRMGGALLDIGWRLAASVILFIAGGSWLDKRFGTQPVFTVIGFLLVIGSFVLIVRQILQKIPRDLGGLK